MNKLKFVYAIIMVVCTLALVSCENEPIDTIVEGTSAVDSTKPQELNAVQEINGLTQRSGSSIHYGVSEDILKYFVHFCQRMAGPNVYSNYSGAFNTITDKQAQNACCPTSYMMAVAALKHAKGDYSFSADAWTLKEIISRFRGPVEYMEVKNLQKEKCAGVDSVSVKTQHGTRQSAKTFIEDALSNNKFVIVPLYSQVYDFDIVNNQKYFSKDITVNSDLQAINENQGNYILKNTTYMGYGHVILIIALEVKTGPGWGGDGIVTYIDPLAKDHSPSNRRYVRYSRLLDSMENMSYRVLSVGY